MSDRCRCTTCYWVDKCDPGRCCSNYTPLCDDIDDEDYLLECDEQRRKEFLNEWYEYSNQYSDSF